MQAAQIDKLEAEIAEMKDPYATNSPTFANNITAGNARAINILIRQLSGGMPVVLTVRHKADKANGKEGRR